MSPRPRQDVRYWRCDCSESVLCIITSLRPDGKVGSFRFDIDSTPLSGKQCRVYAVGFSDESMWVIRVPIHIRHLPPEMISNTVEEEASILKSLERCDFTWSPRLVGYCSGVDNPIAFPYIVSTWIRGTPLQWTENIPQCRENRDKAVAQIGRILTQLVECSQRRCNDTVSFLTGIIDRKLTPILYGKPSDIDPASCLLQRALYKGFCSNHRPNSHISRRSRFIEHYYWK